MQFADRQEREEAVARLKAAEIPSAVYYMKPMHMQKAFEGNMVRAKRCDVTKEVCDVCLSLPMHAYLQEEDIDRICQIL